MGKKLQNIRLEFSIGPGVAGGKMPHVDSAVGAFEKLGLKEASDGVVSTVNGDIKTLADSLSEAIVLAFENGATHFRAILREDTELSPEAHQHIASIEHIARSLGAEVIDAKDASPNDIPLEWDDQFIAAIRRTEPSENNHGYDDFPSIFIEARKIYGQLDQLDKYKKQTVVEWLDNHKAFEVRKSVELLAKEMQVSRATIYNYLKTTRDNKLEK